MWGEQDEYEAQDHSRDRYQQDMEDRQYQEECEREQREEQWRQQQEEANREYDYLQGEIEALQNQIDNLKCRQNEIAIGF